MSEAALLSPRRHDVGGVAGEKQALVAHRLGNEAAQRRDALLDRRSGDQAGGNISRQSPVQLRPERLVRPILDRVLERHLDIIAAEHLRA
jgi:hypothetical protein